MNKRLLKRHKRQVSRAKAQVKLSEPDLRTPEQVRAAREASRPGGNGRKGPNAYYTTPRPNAHAGAASGNTAKGGD